MCESGAVAVSWEPSKGASSYAAVAQGNGGYDSMCNSSETTCLFEDVLCGQNYSIMVHASDGTCSSAGSSPVEINTGKKKNTHMYISKYVCVYVCTQTYMYVYIYIHTYYSLKVFGY